jgi:hypothetical protein
LKKVVLCQVIKVIQNQDRLEAALKDGSEQGAQPPVPDKLGRGLSQAGLQDWIKPLKLCQNLLAEIN